ncbi:hypothetical protein [Absidia glauca]|uniref:Uncharacterized protein n=1 Tax=Absidia glauca TaxID=4829 RepID=A0A168LJ04_ABSGL|nr:hypothetical protein [Absidia glauca]
MLDVHGSIVVLRTGLQVVALLGLPVEFTGAYDLKVLRSCWLSIEIHYIVFHVKFDVELSISILRIKAKKLGFKTDEFSKSSNFQNHLTTDPPLVPLVHKETLCRHRFVESTDLPLPAAALCWDSFLPHPPHTPIPFHLGQTEFECNIGPCFHVGFDSC